MFGKRPDGRVVRGVEPLQMIMPYIMKTRCDSMNMYEDTFPCEGMDTYIKAKATEGIKLSYMHILIAATVRLTFLCFQKLIYLYSPTYKFLQKRGWKNIRHNYTYPMFSRQSKSHFSNYYLLYFVKKSGAFLLICK